MNLLTALVIFLGDDSFLSHKMDEAAKTIRAEELKEKSFLCRETLNGLKNRMGKKRKGKK